MSPKGGKREGAGRPRRYPLDSKRTTVYLSSDEREQLRRIGDGNVTEGIRRLLRGAAA